MATELVLSAELHNEIVRLGWHVTSAPFIPFWEKYSQQQAEIEELVGEDLVAFYKKALVPAEIIHAEDSYQNFFYYLQGLAQPWDRHDFAGTLLGELDCKENKARDRYIVLYEATTAFGGQQGGIIVDQDSGQASMQADFLSTDPSSMVWQPLSTILTTYLHLITLGKVTSANFKSTLKTLSTGEPEPQYPWKYHSYSPEILARTLAAYHNLIDAIEAACEVSTEEKDHELTVYLSTHFNLDAAGFPKTCFVRSFLTAARRPRGPKRIQFIAPGIGLPSTMSIRNQPFRAVAKKHRFATGTPGLPSVRDEEGSNPLYPPFMLFPGEGTKQNKKDTGGNPTFAAPFDGLNELPVGLWLDRAEPWSGQGGEDETVLVMPFALPRRAETTFPAVTTLPLFVVLEEWTGKVKSGIWKVNDKGVVGSVELLREGSLKNDEVRGRAMVKATKHRTNRLI